MVSGLWSLLDLASLSYLAWCLFVENSEFFLFFRNLWCSGLAGDTSVSHVTYRAPQSQRNLHSRPSPLLRPLIVFRPFLVQPLPCTEVTLLTAMSHVLAHSHLLFSIMAPSQRFLSFQLDYDPHEDTAQVSPPFQSSLRTGTWTLDPTSSYHFSASFTPFEGCQGSPEPSQWLFGQGQP